MEPAGTPLPAQRAKNTAGGGLGGWSGSNPGQGRVEAVAIGSSAWRNRAALCSGRRKEGLDLSGVGCAAPAADGSSGLVVVGAGEGGPLLHRGNTASVLQV